MCGHGVTEDFGCSHKATVGYLVWSQGHKSFPALSHGVMTGHEPCEVRPVHPIMPQVPSSSAAHALSESIVY